MSTSVPIDSVRFVVGMSFLLSAACGDNRSPSESCETLHCRACEARRAEALVPGRLARQTGALRWSCADVAGLSSSLRGQEYCESFVIAEVPPREKGEPAPEPALLGKNLGPTSAEGRTPPRIDLTPHQIEVLDAAPSEIAGHCIFSSWNSDIDAPLPCRDEGSCSSVGGFELAADPFRMTYEVNSAEAGQNIVRDCLTVQDSGEEDSFLRGCLLNADINGTSYRKSDTLLCGAAMRLAECACWPEGVEDFPTMLSPWDRRGFPLGTWAGPEELPPGCSYLELGDETRTLVACELSAADLLRSAADVSAACAELYADNIVVHVPLPDKESLVCRPEDSFSAYRNTCTDAPWTL